YFVLLGAAPLQEREQIRLLVFEMDREFIREEGHDGRGLGGRITAEVGDPVQDGASLALAQVHGMQVVDRPAKQGRIDRRQTERTPRLICLLHGMPFRRLQIGARLAQVIAARSARSFTKSRDARTQADFSSACSIFGRTVSYGSTCPGAMAFSRMMCQPCRERTGAGLMPPSGRERRAASNSGTVSPGPSWPRWPPDALEPQSLSRAAAA